ncbi:hypothetical protein B0A49_02775 [Cryomyces minteri]|uniref:Uncharacterized protein n=1 Tax=Cryomyces minteri TaxID=331657 RepID=A0A4U0XPP7_9PEZI|nr:hypothetical protein B0A49_02775 [Cryomyces minteri]
MSQTPGQELMSNGAQLPALRFNYTKTLHKDTYDYISPTRANLANKAVFVTGASKGIGRATALSYARAGASHIALGARSSLSSLAAEMLSAAKEAGRPAPEILTLELDVTSRSSVDGAAEAVKAQFGRLDILVNNAGYLETFVAIADSDPDEWWRAHETNVRGAYLCTRALLPLLLGTAAGLATILFLSSVGAHATRVGASGYQTTKLALLRFAEFVGAEYGAQGLLAFSVHPGGVPSEMGLRMPKDLHWVLTDTPEVAADTIVFLTRERREWLAGRYVSCTWDMEEFLAKRAEIEKGDLLKVRMAVSMGE